MTYFAAPEFSIRVICVLVGLSTLLDSLQYLWLRRHFREDGAWSWTRWRAHWYWPQWASFFAPILDRVLGHPGIVAILVARLLAGLLLVTTFAILPLRMAAIWWIYLSWILLSIRHRSLSGSEDMMKIVCGGLALGHVFPSDPLVLEVCLWFIALQACLSYAGNSWPKWSSREWRNGHALFLIAQNPLHGSPLLFKVLRHRAVLTKLLTWSTLLIETVFPLVLLMGYPWCWFLLGWGLTFHTLTAVLLGLNTFMWSYVATYPAIVFVVLRIESLLNG